MTRDEMRAKCIEAMKAAILTSIPYTWGPMVEEAAIGAFDSLNGIARVCPVEATREMQSAANKDWDGRMSARSAGVWESMSAAGDLTNPPEKKP